MKNIFLTTCIVFLSIFILQAQETETNENQKEVKLGVKVKDGANPDIYVDGKKFEFEFDLLDPDKIESISVIKNEQAIEQYNAPNGVLLITTKKNIEANSSEVKIKNKGKGKKPLIIIDGEVSSEEFLDKLSPDDIVEIEVIKDDMAMEQYNAPNGVIIIKTKKKKK